MTTTFFAGETVFDAEGGEEATDFAGDFAGEEGVGATGVGATGAAAFCMTDATDVTAAAFAWIAAAGATSGGGTTRGGAATLLTALPTRRTTAGATLGAGAGAGLGDGAGTETGAGEGEEGAGELLSLFVGVALCDAAAEEAPLGGRPTVVGLAGRSR